MIYRRERRADTWPVERLLRASYFHFIFSAAVMKTDGWTTTLCRIQFTSWSTWKTSLFSGDDTGIFPFQSLALCPPPQLRQGAPLRARRSGASRPAVPSPSAAAASPTSRHPVPPSASLAVPRNCAEREALAERYYACAFCDKGQGSGDGCRLWHLNVVALTFSSDP